MLITIRIYTKKFTKITANVRRRSVWKAGNQSKRVASFYKLGISNECIIVKILVFKTHPSILLYSFLIFSLSPISYFI